MKNAILFTVSTLILFFGLQTTAHAQKTATWKGGTPGRGNDWFCATNWKEGRVPNEFSDVIIPDVSSSTRQYPIIQQGEIEVNSLRCASSIRLFVSPKASLVVTGGIEADTQMAFYPLQKEND